METSRICIVGHPMPRRHTQEHIGPRLQGMVRSPAVHQANNSTMKVCITTRGCLNMAHMEMAAMEVDSQSSRMCQRGGTRGLKIHLSSPNKVALASHRISSHPLSASSRRLEVTTTGVSSRSYPQLQWRIVHHIFWPHKQCPSRLDSISGGGSASHLSTLISNNDHILSLKSKRGPACLLGKLGTWTLQKSLPADRSIASPLPPSLFFLLVSTLYGNLCSA